MTPRTEARIRTLIQQIRAYDRAGYPATANDRRGVLSVVWWNRHHKGPPGSTKPRPVPPPRAPWERVSEFPDW